jgi:hypothetical protein
MSCTGKRNAPQALWLDTLWIKKNKKRRHIFEPQRGHTEFSSFHVPLSLRKLGVGALVQDDLPAAVVGGGAAAEGQQGGERNPAQHINGQK